MYSHSKKKTGSNKGEGEPYFKIWRVKDNSLLGPVHTAEFHVNLSAESAGILHQNPAVAYKADMSFTLRGNWLAG